MSWDILISKTRFRISMSPRMQAKCNAVAPDVLSVPQIFGQSSCCRQRISAAGDVGLNVEVSLMVRFIPGRSKTNFTREGSPDRMTACRGAQPRGWRVLMRVGEMARSLHALGFKCSRSVIVAEINWTYC